MTLDELISSAAEQPLRSTVVEETATSLGLSIPDLFDCFARTVAERYMRGEYPYSFGDGAMNHLFNYAYVDAGLGLPACAWSVYIAFDEGEYVHPDEPAEAQGEARTRALLEPIVQRGGDE